MQAFEINGKHHLSVKHVLLRFLTAPFVFLVGRLFQNIVRLKSLSAFHFSFLHVLKRFAGLKTYALLLVFLFSFFGLKAQEYLYITAPESLKGAYQIGVQAAEQAWTGQTDNGTWAVSNTLFSSGFIQGDLMLANDGTGAPTLACNALVGTYTGKIVIMRRGTCGFHQKVLNAQNAGAIAVIVVNNADGVQGMTGVAGSTVTIPAVMVSQVDGERIISALGNTVSAYIGKTPPTTGGYYANVPNTFASSTGKIASSSLGPVWASSTPTYYRGQHTITAAQIVASGWTSGAGYSISALGWKFADVPSSYSLTNYTIKMAHNGAVTTAFTGAMTTVKNAYTYTPTASANFSYDMITFDTPFTWDGTSNIAIDVCYYATATPATPSNIYGGNGSYYYTNGSTDRCSVTPGSSSGGTFSIPAARLLFGSSSTAPTVTTPTATAIATTSATLGANVTSDGGASLTARGTVWGTSAAPTTNAAPEGATTTGVFTHSRTGLTANTLYTYRGYATNSVGTSYSADGTFTTLSLAPTIGTGSSATSSGFTANWTAPGAQGSATYTYTVEVDDNSDFSSVTATQSSIASGTLLYAFSSGLSANTTYYYRVKAVNAGGSSAWSATSAGIATLAGSPTVTSPTATAIATTSATLGANVTSNGGASLTARGTVWGISAAPTGNVLAEGATTTGVFTHSRTSLTANTLYTYRGYATNSGGTGYSADGTFTTLSLAPTIGTGSAATSSGFTANWTAPGTQGSATYTYTVEVDDDSNFGSVNTTQSSIASGTLLYAFSGLSSSTTYYYRVKAVNAGGSSAWSSTSSGIATTAPPPTLTLSIATLSGFTYATECGGPSSQQSYTLSGTNLTGAPGNIALTAPTNFEISLTSGSGFAGSVNVPYATATLGNTTIYVRLKTALATNTYTGNITHSGGGATQENLGLNGSVTSASLTQAVIGSGQVNNNVPFQHYGGSNRCNRSSTIYTKAILNQAGGFPSSGNQIINTIGWQASGTGTLSGNVKIYMQNTSATTTGTVDDWSTQIINGATLVYDGAFTFTRATGQYNSITLQTPFTWDNTNNLRVAVEFLSGANLTTGWYRTNSAGNTAESANFSATCAATLANGSNSYYPNLLFNAAPVITLSTSTLSGFSYLSGSGPSSSQNYTVSGANLICSTVNLTAPTNYEISTDNSSFSSSLQLAVSSGIITSQPRTIYVRLKAGLATGDYNSEVLANAAGGASTQNVTLSGTVVDAYTWNGSASSDWNTAANWTPNGTPTAANNVKIPASPTNELEVLSSLTIDANTTFTLESNAKLTLSGTLTNNGTLTLENGATLKQGSSVTGGGTYTVKQTLDNNAGSGSTLTGRYWYMGTPISCVRSVGFGSSGNLNKVWSFTNGAYAAVADATTLSPTTGYVHRRSDNTTLIFTGTNLYAQDVTLSLSNNAGTYGGWHLIANPYTAYLDWHQVANSNLSSNLSNTYYIRSYNSSGAGDVNALISYNSSTLLESNTSSITLTSAQAQYIAPMQAFWVKINPTIPLSATAGQLRLERAFTSHQTGNVGLKNSTVFPTLARVNLVDGARFDQMLVFLNQDMSNAVDQYDSEKMFVSGTPQIYTMAAGKKLVMNGLKNNKKKISLPLYLELPESKVYNLQLAEYILEDGLILLEDKQEGIIQDFTIHDVYPFYANNGVLSNRFVLHFFAPDNGITAQGPSNSWVENETSYTEGGSILIQSDSKGKVQITLDQPETENIDGSVQAVDAHGRVFYTGILEGITTAIQLDVPSGIYYLTVQSGNLIEKKKVFIQE